MAIDYKGFDLLALCLWREARGEGSAGITAVANVIVNRAKRHQTFIDHEVLKPAQFTSMTVAGPWLNSYPPANDTIWLGIQGIAAKARAAMLIDLTAGSTVYYNPDGIIGPVADYLLSTGQTIKMPKGWNQKALKFKIQIGRHFFFAEV